MDGVTWAAAVWGLLLVAVWWRERRLPRAHRRLSRETLAGVLALLGTHSIVGSTDAEEILRNPVASERILRGSLSALALLLIAPILLQRLRARSGSGYRGLAAMLTYLGISGVTVMYSAAPIVTAAKIFELGTGLAVVAAIALHPEASQQIRRTIGLLIGLEAALLVVAVVGFFALPSRFAQLQPRPGFISDYTMGSPYAHSNALSSIGAIVGAYALARVLPKKPDRRTSAWWWILAGFGIAGTILASGRQGVVLWLVSAFVLLLIHRRFALFAVVLPAAAFALTSYGEEIWTALLRNRPTTFASLTGRTHWWSAAIDAWADHPWTGYGYGVGGRFVALESIGRGTTSNIHSGYFEALVGVGLIGLLPLMVAILVALAWTTGGLLRHRETHLTILIVPLILRTAVAQGFGAWLNFEFLLFALLVILADCSSIEARERSRQQRLPPLPSRQLAGVRGS